MASDFRENANSLLKAAETIGVSLDKQRLMKAVKGIEAVLQDDASSFPSHDIVRADTALKDLTNAFEKFAQLNLIDEDKRERLGKLFQHRVEDLETVAATGNSRMAERILQGAEISAMALTRR